MNEALGCYEEGILRFLRQGRTIFATDNFNCSWNRVNDDISTGSWLLPSSRDCCPPTIHARADIVEFERNGYVEWTGYVQRPVSMDGIFTVEASDLLSGYQYRIIRDPQNFTATDLATIAASYLSSADGSDPIPVVPLFSPTGVTGTRLVTLNEYRICWDALTELLAIGLDVTMVGALLYIGPVEDKGMKTIKLNERMILGVPSSGEDGPAYANRIIAKGANGLVSIYPSGPAVAPFPYPLVEAVVDAGDVADQSSLDALAKQHWDLRASVPRFVSFSEGVSLKSDSPYPLRAWIPGRLVDVTLDTDCVQYQAGQRLQSVSYSLTNKIEEIKVATVPMGTIPEGLVA